MTVEIHEFAGMGSKAAKDRSLARHRALLDGPQPTGEDPGLETAIVRGARQGRSTTDDGQHFRGAREDLARESERLAANAPYVEAQLAAIREANHERDLRRLRRAAQRPPDRVTRSTVIGHVPVPGTGPWERLAARGFAEAQRLTINDGRLPSHFDPDTDDDYQERM
jgi:hypothetical protein